MHSNHSTKKDMRRWLIGAGAGVVGFGAASLASCEAESLRRTDKVRGVVIGGGCAGSMLVMSMDHLMNLTLVDKKSYFEFTPILKEYMLGQPKSDDLQEEDKNWFRKYFVPHRLYMHNSKLVVGEVAEVAEHHVVLKNGKKIAFDFCFICTGSGSNVPWRESRAMTVTERAAEMAKYSRLIDKCEKITIIGGGATGVENAAVLRREHPEKEISLLHSHQTLVPAHRPKTSHYVEQKLREAGVDVKTMAKVTDVDYDPETNKFVVKYTYADRDGEVIDERIVKQMEPVDYVMDCRGINPLTQCLQKNFSSHLDDRGFVQVNEFNQLDGHPHIFALGDIARQDSEHGRESGLSYIVDHVSTVTAMITSIAFNNKISSGNNIFDIGFPMQFIQLGPQDHVGASQLIGETRSLLATFISRKLYPTYLAPFEELKMKNPVSLDQV